MKEMGMDPNLVTYNVMLDAYGKMGRSWDKIVGLLDKMRSKGLAFDEFTCCSSVISACGREGLLEEAKEFFSRLKSEGYEMGTVTYNAILQVFGKAGVYSEASSILGEMEESNCSPDTVTYNELVGAYLKSGFYEEANLVMEKMIGEGVIGEEGEGEGGDGGWGGWRREARKGRGKEGKFFFFFGERVRVLYKSKSNSMNSTLGRAVIRNFWNFRSS